MAKKIQLKIITPERLVLEELVDRVTLPTTEGEITILPDHIPLVANLATGDIVGFKGNDPVPLAVVGGFVEVNKKEGESSVVILADFAEHVSDITDEAVEAARSQAEELQKKFENKEIVDFEHFEAELERSLTRVKIADKWRKKKYK